VAPRIHVGFLYIFCLLRSTNGVNSLLQKELTISA